MSKLETYLKKVNYQEVAQVDPNTFALQKPHLKWSDQELESALRDAKKQVNVGRGDSPVRIAYIKAIGKIEAEIKHRGI